MEETTTPTVTTRSVGIKYGLILAGISTVYFLGMTFAGIDMTQGPGRWVSFIFYLAIIFLAQQNFKEEGDGFMPYGKGIGISFWIGLVSSVAYSIFFYVYVKFVDSSFIENMKNVQMEQMQERGMSQEQIDQAMQISGAFMTPEALLGFGIFFGVIMVVVCGLVVTIFTQKANPNTEI